MEKPWKKGRLEMTNTYFDTPTFRLNFAATLPTVIGGLLVWSGCLMLMI